MQPSRIALEVNFGLLSLAEFANIERALISINLFNAAYRIVQGIFDVKSEAWCGNHKPTNIESR